MKQRLNNWINHHKYEVIVTGIAIVTIMMLRKKAGVVVVGNAKDIISDEGYFGYLTFG